MSRLSALYDVYLRKVPRQSRARSVVDAILTATSDRLAGTAEEDLTLEDVASRAGVGIGSLYDYFRDRQSLLSALAAKLTEDNLKAFEEVLASTHDLPLQETMARLIDLAFETYLVNPGTMRTALRVGHAVQLMPTVAHCQNIFAESLAKALKQRADVTTEDVDLAAWTITHSMMGVMLLMIWQTDAKYKRSAIRGDLLRMFTTHLTR